jgi:hypothetical protein
LEKSRSGGGGEGIEIKANFCDRGGFIGKENFGFELFSLFYLRETLPEKFRAAPSKGRCNPKYFL